MDSTLLAGILGATIALVAAVLTSVTEAVKGKWSVRVETASWRRQTMFAFTHQYVEAAFAIAGESGNARRRRISGTPLLELQPFLDRCHTSHTDMITALTALRLIAPKAVVLAAEAAHDSCHTLINLAMGEREPNSEPDLSYAAWEQRRSAAKQDRADLVIEMRRAFGIESDAVPFGASVASSWTVPADILD